MSSSTLPYIPLQQPTSPLLRLPPELRNKIYTLVFAKSHTIDYWTRKPSPRKRHALALQRTCRQLYQETKRLHLSLPTFVFASYASFTRWVATFNKEKLSAIQYIEFTVASSSVTVMSSMFGGGGGRAMPMYWWNERDLDFRRMGLTGLRCVRLNYVKDREWAWDDVDEGALWRGWEGNKRFVEELWETEGGGRLRVVFEVEGR